MEPVGTSFQSAMAERTGARIARIMMRGLIHSSQSHRPNDCFTSFVCFLSAMSWSYTFRDAEGFLEAARPGTSRSASGQSPSRGSRSRGSARPPRRRALARTRTAPRSAAPTPGRMRGIDREPTGSPAAIESFCSRPGNKDRNRKFPHGFRGSYGWVDANLPIPAGSARNAAPRIPRLPK